MSSSRPPTGSIPTLTEVVTWPAAEPTQVATPPASAPAPAPVPVPPSTAAAAATTPALPVDVVPVPPPVPAVAPAAPTATEVAASVLAPAPAMPARAPIDEAGLRQRVFDDIQRQVDLMLEVRLREALAPALARATDALVRDARKELNSTLRDVVSKSVAQALANRDDT